MANPLIYLYPCPLCGHARECRDSLTDALIRTEGCACIQATMDDETIEIADLIIDQAVDRGMPTLLPDGRVMPSPAGRYVRRALIDSGLSEEQARALLQRRLGHDLQVCGRSTHG